MDKTRGKGKAAHPLVQEAAKAEVDRLAPQRSVTEHDFVNRRLLVARSRLTESPGPQEVYSAIQDIVATLIGCEEIAIFEYDPSHAALLLRWSCGINPDHYRQIPLGVGRMGRSALLGTSYFAGRETEERPALPHEENLTACLILQFRHQLIGAVALFGLLPQKPQLEHSDYGLLEFLEEQGAEALRYARQNQMPIEKKA